MWSCPGRFSTWSSVSRVSTPSRQCHARLSPTWTTVASRPRRIMAVKVAAAPSIFGSLRPVEWSQRLNPRRAAVADAATPDRGFWSR